MLQVFLAFYVVSSAFVKGLHCLLAGVLELLYEVSADKVSRSVDAVSAVHSYYVSIFSFLQSCVQLSREFIIHIFWRYFLSWTKYLHMINIP